MLTATIKTRGARRFLTAGLAAFAAAACGGGGTGPSGVTVLEFTAGGQQSGVIGTALPVRIVVLAKNGQGPVTGTTVTMSVESSGGGSVAPAQAVTGSSGTAQFTWTLGTTVGTQVLTARTTGSNPVQATLQATGLAAPPSAVNPVTVSVQNVVVGRAVSILPKVLVTNTLGSPVAGVAVVFEAVQGASVLTGTSQTTDAQGHATLGGWTLGSTAQTYTIRARIASGAETIFQANGVPAAIVSVAGGGQSANAGTAVAVAPAVRATRDDGSPLPNVVINFTVVGGGGSVLGSSVATGADGTARPTQWVLGLTPGANRLEASTLGAGSVFFDATGTPAAPASVTASGGASLNGVFGNYLSGTPQVTVTDAQGNPVAGQTVSFAVSQGGGQVTLGGTSQTDFQGKASPTSWRLGSAGVQTVTATLGALPPVVFTATGSAPPPGTFRIEVRYPGQQPTPQQQAAFDNAANRWKQLLLAGGDPYTIKPDEIIAGCGAVSGTVDGVIIIANFIAIDGPGQVLGRAGPCVLRDDGFLPVTGLMEFDTADLAAFGAQLENIVIHEMGHVLGFATIWDIHVPGLGTNAFSVGVPGGDPSFNGQGARAAFFGAIASGVFTGVPVPLENTGGGGTIYKHWRETIFTNELMTGFLNSGLNPLSAITVQHFRDLGYVVNDALADAYTFHAAIQGAGLPSFRLVEGQLSGLMTIINRQGRVVARVARPPLR